LQLASAHFVHGKNSMGKGRAGLISKLQLLSEAITRSMDDNCTTMAGALAYYTTFSIAPLLLIVISIAGQFKLSFRASSGRAQQARSARWCKMPASTAQPALLARSSESLP